MPFKGDPSISVLDLFQEIDGRGAQAARMSEVDRAILSIIILSNLGEPCHGYALRIKLVELGLVVDENLLYPMLRKWESRGVLHGFWTEESGRNRRCYALTSNGMTLLTTYRTIFQRMIAVLSNDRFALA